MIHSVYILFIVLGFVFLALGAFFGSYRSKVDTSEIKIGLTYTFLGISLVSFVAVALGSFYVTTDACQNQVTATITNGNNTQLDGNTTQFYISESNTNQISCITVPHTDTSMAYGFFGLILIDIALMIIYSLPGRFQ